MLDLFCVSPSQTEVLLCWFCTVARLLGSNIIVRSCNFSWKLHFGRILKVFKGATLAVLEKLLVMIIANPPVSDQSHRPPPPPPILRTTKPFSIGLHRRLRLEVPNLQACYCYLSISALSVIKIFFISLASSVGTLYN